MLAGGSNVVVADDGFPGTVVHVLTRGVERDGTRSTVQAGEPWDPFVAARVGEGLAGIECLSGIPGSTGATPIQNVGAYGQEVAEVDHLGAGVRPRRARGRRAGAGRVRLQLPLERLQARAGRVGRAGRLVRARTRSRTRGPIRYAELARTLGVELGESAPLAEVREAVLACGGRRGW